ncbi:DUF488 family protein [Saccharothrix saharensis]|uniref:DUF488 domain-containing protein n=1 Tax=Saccharothrix saharensis TaxID=571190 RepID=UPI003673920A
MKRGEVLTIGHSVHDFPNFVRLLRRHGVTAVADVRSVPLSRFNPQFNRGSVERGLHDSDIRYAFLGKELGARTEDLSCYVDGRVQYERLAKTPEFISGIDRVLRGARTERIAVMCAEREPLDCHRTILVARVLVEHGLVVGHVHADGRSEDHDEAMDRLMAGFGLLEDDLFRTRAERLDEALSRQESRIAYVDDELRENGTAQR